jgi:outer membrane protein TolC
MATIPEPYQLGLAGDDGQPIRDGPLNLDQAIDLAFRLNPGLEVMRERIAQAESGRQIAFADFLPEAFGSLRHIEGTPHTELFALPTLPISIGNVAAGGVSDRFNRAELSVQWLLWDFGRTPGKFGQAVAAVEIAKLQYLRARQTVTFNVTAAYLAVLQARATRRVADEAVVRAESVLRDARNFLKRGIAIRNDVLRADVLLAEMRLNLVKARTAEAVAVAGLNQTIGINVSNPTQLADLPEETAFEQSLADCLQLAADNRDEFQVVLRAVRSARLGTGVAQADFLPKILVGGTALHQEAAGVKEVNMAFGGVSLELALFEGGRRLGKLRGAEAEVRSAVAQGKEMCDRIAYEVNVAYFGIDDARQRISLSRTAVSQATENLRVVRALIEKGDATPTDVVDAELAITRARQNYFTALYDYQTALARLNYAMGIGGKS